MYTANNIVDRKEFAQLYEKDPGNVDTLFAGTDYLKLAPYQTFVERYINPRTPFNRLFINWQTGMGKTIGAISIGKNFADKFRREYEESNGTKIRKVYILGFSENIFRNEMMRTVGLGFVTKEQQNEFRTAVINIMNNIDVEENMKKRNSIIMQIRARISNVKKGGFYEFIGYKLLVTYIEKYLWRFNDSIIICDEIHNIYNSKENNNWGEAINTILEKTNCKAVFMSATPMTNSPMEIISILNLLRDDKPPVTREMIFSSDDVLTSNALNIIKEYTHNKFSYINNLNPMEFPSFSFVGTTIPGIPILKFIRARFSKEYDESYSKVTHSQSIPYVNDLIINDIHDSTELIADIINNKEKYAKMGIEYDSKENMITGEFLKLENIGKYSPKYETLVKEIHKIIKEQKDVGKMLLYHNYVNVSGSTMLYNLLQYNGFISEGSNIQDDTLCIYCGIPYKDHSKEIKSDSLDLTNSEDDLSKVKWFIESSGGKPQLKFAIKKSQKNIIKYFKELQEYNIYKNSTFVEGDKLIFILNTTDELGNATRERVKQSSANHDYAPAIVALILNKNKKVVTDRFNNDHNRYGDDILVAIGSQSIKEGIDFRALRHEFIVSRPDNISTLIQIRGRAIRKNSHILLSEKDRNVKIYLVTGQRYNGGLTYEEEMYRRKMIDFELIKKMEHSIYEGSLTRYLSNGKTIDDPLDIYKLAPYDFKIPSSFPNGVTTYSAFYIENEIAAMKSAIKRTVASKQIWNYNVLRDTVLASNYTTNTVNLSISTHELYDTALSELNWIDDNSHINIINKSAKSFVDSILDQSKAIYCNGATYVIRCVTDNSIISKDNSHSSNTYVLFVPFENNKVVGNYFRPISDPYVYCTNVGEYINTSMWEDDLNDLYNREYNDYADIIYILLESKPKLAEVVQKDAIELLYESIVLRTYNKKLDILIPLIFFLKKIDAMVFASSKKNGAAVSVLADYQDISFVKVVSKDKIAADITDVSMLIDDTIVWLTNEYMTEFIIFKYVIKQCIKNGTIDPDMLPIGFNNQVYSPLTGWRYAKITREKEVENEYIIGFRDPIDTKFKTRPPTRNVADKRNMHNGTVCTYKKKSELIDILKHLNPDDDVYIDAKDEYCYAIEDNLIKKQIEMNEIYYIYGE